MTSETPEVVQVKEEFERCEKLWNSLTTGLQSLPAAMEPWKKVTSKHQELGDWFDDIEEQASRDLEALGEVQDDTTDVCDHIYRLKVLKCDNASSHTPWHFMPTWLANSADCVCVCEI